MIFAPSVTPAVIFSAVSPQSNQVFGQMLCCGPFMKLLDSKNSGFQSPIFNKVHSSRL
ncbi:hypothetical protein NPIL_677331, partial [Nephila pilipes]